MLIWVPSPVTTGLNIPTLMKKVNPTNADAADTATKSITMTLILTLSLIAPLLLVFGYPLPLMPPLVIGCLPKEIAAILYMMAFETSKYLMSGQVCYMSWAV